MSKTNPLFRCYLPCFGLTMLFYLGAIFTVEGQTQYASKDTLAPYEVPFVIGEAQELVVKLFFDLNGLKENVSEDVKMQLLGYIYETFDEGDKGSMQSDLRYTTSSSTLSRRSPITIGKYTSDFETELEIKNIALDLNSFKFTLPELQGPNLYEMYGSYAQYFRGEMGDTLNAEPQIKLVRYVMQRDEASNKIQIKIRSIAFIDPNKMPEFIEEEDLAILSQEYLKWRKSESENYLPDAMTSEAISDILNVGRSKREAKARNFDESVAQYLTAKEIGDALKAADEFFKAEKLQRQNPIIVRNKDDVISELTSFIERHHKRTEDAVNAWNFQEANSLILESKKALDLWNSLNNRSYQDAGQILGMEEDVNEKYEHWKNYSQKIENNTFRKDLKKQMDDAVNGADCSNADNKETLAEGYAVLGLIAMKEAEQDVAYGANESQLSEGNGPSRKANADKYGQATIITGYDLASVHFKDALKCRAEFALPKVSLADIHANKPDAAVDYFSDLLYFENQNPKYFLNRGLNYQKLKKKTEAEQDFKSAIALDPAMDMALQELSKILLSNNNSEDALKYLHQLKFVGDGDPIADIFLAYAYLEAEGYGSENARIHAAFYKDNRLTEVRQSTLDSLIGIFKDQTVYYRTQTKQFGEAAKYYEKMFVLAGHLPEYYGEWAFAAECYYELGNTNNYYDRAAVFADSSISKSRGASQLALLVRGRVKRAKQDYAESKTSLLELVKIDKGFMPRYEIGETFFQQGEELVVARVYFEDALAKLLKEETKSKSFVKYNYLLNLRIGQCFRVEEKTKMSVEHITKAIKTKYLEGEGYYELGLTYLRSRDKKGAIKSLSKFDEALKKGFDPFLVKSAKAEALLLSGEYKKSDQLLGELAVQFADRMRPEDWLNRSKAVGLNHSGGASSSIVRLDAASNYLRAALSADPDFENSILYLNQLGIIELTKYKSTGIAPAMLTRALENAENAFRAAGDLEITEPVSQLGMSMVYFYSNDKAQAKALLESSFEQNLVIPEMLEINAFGSYWKDKQIKGVVKSNKKS